MKQSPLIRLLPWLLSAVGLAVAVGGCGGPPHKVDTDSIRRNADDADRDLDRESEKNKEN